jgi:hypothetical protein
MEFGIDFYPGILGMYWYETAFGVELCLSGCSDDTDWSPSIVVTERGIT